MDLYAIVKKLAGQIQPVGESGEDSRRFTNLEKTLELIDCLLQDVVHVALQAGRHEASVSKAGKRAEAYLELLPESIEF